MRRHGSTAWYMATGAADELLRMARLLALQSAETDSDFAFSVDWALRHGGVRCEQLARAFGTDVQTVQGWANGCWLPEDAGRRQVLDWIIEKIQERAAELDAKNEFPVDRRPR
ncbi:MAG TPA: hypothetical protein VN495_00700 [Candidatus Paceibacterota bacterium]|nr:hypothetical protein [Candidatus Paceibacterota bacterium]